jgi:hypothetical protein
VATEFVVLSKNTELCVCPAAGSLGANLDEIVPDRDDEGLQA